MKLTLNRNKNFILFAVAILLIGCNNETIKKETFLKVSNSKLIYQGEIADKAKLDIKWKNDTIKCFIRTVFIMENDTLNSIKASIIDNNLSIDITTSPYDNPYWYDMDKLTKVHDVEFDLTGLKAGTYFLNLQINNTYSYWKNFSIN